MRPTHPIAGASGAKMVHYTAHVTPSDGIPRRLELRATDLQAARTAAHATAVALFRTGFTYSVRPA